MDYPKTIMSINDQVSALREAGLYFETESDLVSALNEIGFYRLRGYTFPYYDNKTKTFIDNTTLDTVLKIYKFDEKLRTLLMSMLSKIEVNLRSVFIEAMLSTYSDALVLLSPVFAKNKQLYWNNLSSIASETARSKDRFIIHNYLHHDGMIPIWATVEVISFGTLSKLIGNLMVGKASAYNAIASRFSYCSNRGNQCIPSHDMLSSWVRACGILRNICAHNSRLYNRTISIKPIVLQRDMSIETTHNPGIYTSILAMKYIRPNDSSWSEFVDSLKKLIEGYSNNIMLSDLGFPDDWEKHLSVEK